MITNVRYYLLLLCLFPIVQSFNVTYIDYANHYKFLFDNYQPSSVIPTARTIVFVEKLFDFELTHAQGYINMFAYSCYYWNDTSLPRWNIKTQFKLGFFTFMYNKDKCPLDFPFIKSSSPNDYVTIKNNGLVFTCPHTSRRLICNHVEESKYPKDLYSCSYPLTVYSNETWPIECGSYSDLDGTSRRNSSDNCRTLNENFYPNQKIDLPTNDWSIKQITIAAYKKYTYLTIVLERNKGPQYINDVMVAITLGVVASSILLIPFHNKIRIFIAVFLLLASNIWLRFGLAEQAFIQYSLNENLIRYYQVVFIVQIITLALSCINNLIVSKLYAHYQPPVLLSRLCSQIAVLGRIDPVFKKRIYFFDGIPLNVDGNDDKADQNSATISLSIMGWKEITLIMDRVIFIVLLNIVIISGIVLLK